MAEYIAYIDNVGYVITKSTNRPNFLPQTKNNQPKGKDICHGISFQMMKEAVVLGLNYCLNGEIRTGVMYLAGVVAAVLRIELQPLKDLYINGKGISDLDINDLKICIPDNYREIIKHIEEEFTGPAGYTPEDEADELLINLFKEPFNLRYGDASWNRCVEDAFDPTDFQRDDDGNVVLSDNDSIAVTNMVYLVPETPPFFYTFAYDGKKDDMRGIVSSDNKYAIPEKTYKAGDVKIVYFDYFKEQCYCIDGTPFDPNEGDYEE